MQMAQSLKLEQTQKLFMTYKLQQAISLLQLSSLELNDLIQEELQNNPVLEAEESEGGEEAGTDRDESAGPVREQDAIDWELYLREEGYEPLPGPGGRMADESVSYDYYLSKEPTLQEYLLLQSGYCRLSDREQKVLEFLIGNIDQNGYLRGELQEFASLLGVARRELESALQLLQQFDPAGVGARTLRECLLLQLRERKDAPPLAQKIIELYLEDVAENRYKKIAHALQAELSLVQEAVDFIRTLEPKPGRLTGNVRDDVCYIQPDIIIERVAGDYCIMLSRLSAPRLAINPYYRALLSQGTCESLTSSFIKSRLDSALWLLRSIEQRRLTLYRVAEAIVKLQRRFFEEGIRGLQPLVLRQIADEIGVHESTVSRATANKYAQTPRGIFPLKFFFASGVEGREGVVSSESIKSHLREVISAENVCSPLSDQRLTELLAKRGITVSRRTVAKYREELDIPSSGRRKRHCL
jgi:RNA polymerase sigma-54 factor